jgi:hypothetical protein
VSVNQRKLQEPVICLFRSAQPAAIEIYTLPFLVKRLSFLGAVKPDVARDIVRHWINVRFDQKCSSRPSRER